MRMVVFACMLLLLKMGSVLCAPRDTHTYTNPAGEVVSMDEHPVGSLWDIAHTARTTGDAVVVATPAQVMEMRHVVLERLARGLDIITDDDLVTVGYNDTYAYVDALANAGHVEATLVELRILGSALGFHVQVHTRTRARGGLVTMPVVYGTGNRRVHLVETQRWQPGGRIRLPSWFYLALPAPPPPPLAARRTRASASGSVECATCGGRFADTRPAGASSSTWFCDACAEEHGRACVDEEDSRLDEDVEWQPRPAHFEYICPYMQANGVPCGHSTKRERKSNAWRDHKKHMETHNEGFPYECGIGFDAEGNFCGHRSKTAHAMRCHERGPVHRGALLHTCPIPGCTSLGFRTWTTYDWHMVEAHAARLADGTDWRGGVEERRMATALTAAGIRYEREYFVNFRRLPPEDRGDRQYARVDFMIEHEGGYIMLEVDEEQHRGWSYTIRGDALRMSYVERAMRQNGLNGPILWLRYNPDTFAVGGSGRHNLVGHVERLAEVIRFIREWSFNGQPGTTTVYMYYDQTDEGRPTVIDHPDYPPARLPSVRWE